MRIASNVLSTKRSHSNGDGQDHKQRRNEDACADLSRHVLAEEGRPMTCKELIGAMAIKGYWTSPGGKTPDATLYSALLREITVKGDQSRFVKSGPGHFLTSKVKRCTS